jgi:Putative peptidoglycan binding domain/N-acetylmuramoyl-L-alanine amidase
MSFSLTWLPEVLEDAGLRVAEQPGWRTRGSGDVPNILGVMCHHTAGPRNGIMPSLGIVTNGRPDLSGPLSQLCLGRDGTFFVVAAGRANHAGAGNWQGISSGNSSFIGIEAENTGYTQGAAADPWPAVQMDAYRRGVAAILKKIRANAIMCCGHKEYALPQGRKPDPTFDMPEFRLQVAAIMAGTAPLPSRIPAVDAAARPTLRRGSQGELVREIQKKIQVSPDGVFGGHTEAAIRQFQRDNGLVPDGIVGPRTWAALDVAPLVYRAAVSSSKATDEILRIAGTSDISRYSWKQRGRAPIGYIKGMALTYARLCQKLRAGDPAAIEMAKADTANRNTDALAWYAEIFAASRMDNSVAGVDTLRHLFVLLIGLGMRESSGQHCEGRDRSASNTTAETAEAGLFQTSFNARKAHPLLSALFSQYSANPSGFLDVFKEGVRCSPANHKNFGSGAGRDFQRLSKECPAFAAEFAALALRNIRKHWGPISTRKAELRQECDEMLLQVQNVVEDLSETQLIV